MLSVLFVALYRRYTLGLLRCRLRTKAIVPAREMVQSSIACDSVNPQWCFPYPYKVDAMNCTFESAPSSPNSNSDGVWLIGWEKSRFPLKGGGTLSGRFVFSIFSNEIAAWLARSDDKWYIGISICRPIWQVKQRFKWNFSYGSLVRSHDKSVPKFLPPLKRHL